MRTSSCWPKLMHTGVTLLALLLAQSTMAASYTVNHTLQGRANGGVGDANTPTFSDAAEVDWQSAPASSYAVRDVNSLGALARGEVSAATGVGAGIHLDATAGGSIPPARAYAYGRATASGRVNDSFTLQATGLSAGTQVLATVALNISGTLHVPPLALTVPEGMRYWGQAEWRADFYLGDGRAVLAEWHGWRADAITNGHAESSGNALPGVVLLTLPVVIGTPVFLDLEASVFAAGGAEASMPLLGNAVFEGSGAAHFGHTFAWGGIQSLTLNGVDVTGYTALSATSGFDFANAYVAAVPEPHPSWLLATGLVLTAWRLRRRGT